jgi:tryptophan 2,3-dioxygenase
MARDYSVAILDGEGATDYARYMRTDMLLSLQRRPEDMVHRDELLFQVVHQSAELWLKLANAETAEAIDRIAADALDTASRLLGRAALAIDLMTQQLEMLESLTPWTFQTIRTVLGHGSGFESPGWAGLQKRGRELNNAFTALTARDDVDWAEVYRGSPDTRMYRLAEALINWDEAVALWRTRHYKVATRIIGHEVTGTKGAPVDSLVRLVVHKFLPDLWQVRTELTRTGPMEMAP